MLHAYLNMLEVVAHYLHVLVVDIKLHDAAGVSQTLQVGKGPEINFG